MRNTYRINLGIIIISLLLSGCLYPDSERSENQVPYEDQLKVVQDAVDQYQNDLNGLVPIRTKPNDTPIFEKYLIDFSLLKDNRYLSEIPGNAYEKGGIYQYVLITPDTNPTVKLIDLRITEAIRSLNVKLDIYRDEHLYPPFGEKIEENVFMIDYKKLGLEATPTVKSPYSNEQLPIVMDVDGMLYVDYRIDLAHALSHYEHDYEEGEDIRYILANNTPFVPAYSLPYTIRNNEPVFLNGKD
ncbi:hypothetical protein D8M04_02690 [Oceanobacillus piezotolerans]|uniref:ABC transporter periplasmic binding protein yphF n=1 Tax=Oceanobacillus piezotolerans TaxID=2448030 RepID=A0A498DB31_9BACI|nr:hypothetical protein [Oceanobacillus piezotolerans]RLL48201.1 hypothetical protein D8M04_02690 [Oceanobacillus piezotolerans]